MPDQPEVGWTKDKYRRPIPRSSFHWISFYDRITKGQRDVWGELQRAAADFEIPGEKARTVSANILVGQIAAAWLDHRTPVPFLRKKRNPKPGS